MSQQFLVGCVLGCLVCAPLATNGETSYQNHIRATIGRTLSSASGAADRRFSQAASREALDRPGIAVLVYDYAAVPADTMNRARERVNRLYRETGVEIEWLDPPAASSYRIGSMSNPSRTFTVQMMIRSKRASRGPSTPASVMGEALSADETGGTLSVFLDQVVRVARRYNQPLADILGLTMAHEIGHLLLPVPGHSSTGIMRPDWGGDDVRRGVFGSLAFTSAQAALIREKVDRCRLHGVK